MIKLVESFIVDNNVLVFIFAAGGILRLNGRRFLAFLAIGSNNNFKSAGFDKYESAGFDRYESTAGIFLFLFLIYVVGRVPIYRKLRL